MTPLEILAVKLPDPEINETQRALAIAEIEQQIKTYCNIEAVPDALHFIWANMAGDLLRYKPADETVGKVSSISEGDTSVHFAKDDSRDVLDKLILNYKQQLQAFRKVRR